MDDWLEAAAWLAANNGTIERVAAWRGFGLTAPERLLALDGLISLCDAGTACQCESAQLLLGPASPVTAENPFSHAMVVFGGRLGYPDDDLGAASEMTSACNISAAENGENLDGTMVDALSYAGFSGLVTAPDQDDGFDLARKVAITSPRRLPEGVTEVFTSSHWLVRVFALASPGAVDPPASADQDPLPVSPDNV